MDKWSKQWLEEVVPYIITGVEKEIFINLSGEIERGQFIENFWKKRDPNPETSENEFKQEYYKRIALANKFFGSSGIEGWRTERGKTYIILGPPNEIQREMNSLSSAFSTFHGPKEIWNYWGLTNPKLPYNLEFAFVDKFGTGDYVLDKSLIPGQKRRSFFDLDSTHYNFDHMENITEAMKNPFEKLDKLKGIVKTQVTYNHIPLNYELFYLKGPEQKTYVPLVIEIPYSAIPEKKINNDFFFSLTLLIDVSNNLGQIILEKSKYINFKHTLKEMNSLKEKTFRIQTSLSFEQGADKIHLLVMDNFSGKVGTIHQKIAPPMFNSNTLSMSDIVLLSKNVNKTSESSLIEDRLFLESNHVFQADKKIDVFFEVYNLMMDPESGLNNFNVEYLFLHNERLITKVPSGKIKPTAEKDCRVQISFRLKNFKPGEYTLRIKIDDINSGKTVTKEIQFLVIHPL